VVDELHRKRNPFHSPESLHEPQMRNEVVEGELHGVTLALLRPLGRRLQQCPSPSPAKEAHEVQVQNQSPIPRPRTLPKSGFRAQKSKSNSELEFEVQVQVQVQSKLGLEVQVQVQVASPIREWTLKSKSNHKSGQCHRIRSTSPSPSPIRLGLRSPQVQPKTRRGTAKTKVRCGKGRCFNG
jgi:hypothetical protein